MEFSENLESGQKLEYEVLDAEKQTARVKGCSTSISGDLKIPNTVNHNGITYLITAIKNAAFYECKNLKSVTIPNMISSIGEEAFYDCNSLKQVEIPDSVTNIGEETFKNCSCLTSITIPNSVTNIKSGTFFGCTNLTNVIIPNSVKFINSFAPGPNFVRVEGAFSSCSGLKSVTIPESVTNIECSSFSYCDSLVNITIPNSVTRIGEYAFEGCRKLISVTEKAKTPPTCENNPFSVYNTLYVPMESLDLYKRTWPWKQFKHISGVDFSDKPIYHSEAKLYVLGTGLQNKENELVTIYDATGNTVMRSNDSVISMETLEPGIYTIATIWGFFKYERYKPIYQAKAKLYVSGLVLQNKNNDLVIIYDATGKTVTRSAASIISMEELPKGTYMVATIWGSFMIER